MATMNMAQAVNNAIDLEMGRDPDILMLGEDIGAPGGPIGITTGLQEKYGKKRVIDTPISESGFMGAAVGAAATGLRPIVELMFVDFIGVTMDQLFNQAAKMRFMFGGKAKIPMVVRTMCGGGLQAAAQHSQCLEAWFMHIPGIKVVMPSSPRDAKGLLISSIRDDNPVVFMEHKAMYFAGIEGEVPEEAYTIPLGKAEVKREGTDVTVVCTGMMVLHALGAAETLAAEGVSAEIVDPRTLSPLDVEAILDSVRKTHKMVIVHEEVKFAGSGAEIAAIVADEAFDYLDAPIKRVAAPFCPPPFAKVLEDAFIPSEGDIIAAVKSVMG